VDYKSTITGNGDVMAQTYRYDLLNRFVSSKVATGSSITDVAGMSGDAYSVNVTYDANSNITAFSRTTGSGALLDQMTYRYATKVFDDKTMKLNNRLLHVNDAASTPGIDTDMEDQGAYNPNNAASWNYRYDAMGRIISNRHDGIARIEYNAYNKIKRVVPTDDSRPTLEYTYDAMQQRLSKKAIEAGGNYTETFYAYDAMGVLMSTYTHHHTAEGNTITLNDFMVYGSSRVGSYVANEPEGGTTAPAFTAANLRFELTDHLGTVRAVITGEKTGEGEANIISLTDYYPYGLDMPGRTFMAEQYRYGYQGSERDPEMSGGAGYTTFFRALDPRIGRWLTPDPKVFPWQSPYVSMDGNPVALVDPWGASTDGPDGEYNSGKQTGSGTADDPYYERGNITDGSFLIDGVDVSPPAATANTPANTSFAPVSTMVFNDIVLQQQIKPGSRAKNGQGGIMVFSDFAKGSGFEGGNPDWSIDISGFDVAVSARAGDKPSDVSNALPALMGALSGIVQEVTSWLQGFSFGSEQDGVSEVNEPEVKPVTEAEIEGIIRELNPPSPVPQRYMLGDSIQIDIVPTEAGETDSVKKNIRTGTSFLFKRRRDKSVWLETSKKPGDKSYGPGKIVD
jgi:RHS repeat-associated protein